MGYTTSIATMKWWDSHTNKPKYFSSQTFDEHINKFLIGWPTGSELITGKHISSLLTLKWIYLITPS